MGRCGLGREGRTAVCQDQAMEYVYIAIAIALVLILGAALLVPTLTRKRRGTVEAPPAPTPVETVEAPEAVPVTPPVEQAPVVPKPVVPELEKPEPTAGR